MNNCNCACGEMGIIFHQGVWYCGNHLPKISPSPDLSPVENRKFAQATDLVAVLERIVRLEEAIFNQQGEDSDGTFTGT